MSRLGANTLFRLNSSLYVVDLKEVLELTNSSLYAVCQASSDDLFRGPSTGWREAGHLKFLASTPLSEIAMTNLQPVANPFALMMDPESILRAIESSERLARLNSHICRPLDKPLIPKRAAGQIDYDKIIDAEVDAELDGDR
jgi:hypothetical protein